MKNQKDLIWESILHDMAEGVLTIRFDGSIEHVNSAAETILERPAQELLGRKFAACFFESEKNDAFNQAVLDAVYDPSGTHEGIVPYHTEKKVRQLYVKTSFLHGDSGEPVGIIVVLSDISELVELRDAVLAMERIKQLNHQLELRNRLLSETFGRFLSDDIVRELLDTPNGLALGGKKCCLTILISDLRGFTPLSEQMNPQALIAMLNYYLGEMTEVIQKRGGTIIEFIGDSIFAIFGAPSPSDHHAADAVAAAVEMETRMTAVNEWNAAHGYPELHMGIGVHTGEAIVGNIGSEKRMKYGVVGSNVNLAGRIESYTVGGQILISAATRAAVSESLTITHEMQVFPKGVQNGLVLSQVTGIGSPYNVTCPWHLEEPIELPKPLPVTFFRVTDKHCENAPHAGSLTARSPAAALLHTEVSLAKYSNLELALPNEKLFAKVMAARKQGIYLLAITAAEKVTAEGRAAFHP